jgi:hypothetical protein
VCACACTHAARYALTSLATSTRRATCAPLLFVPQCAPGKYNNEEGLSTDCHPCPVGKFNSLIGAHSCAMCPAGGYCPDVGAASVSMTFVQCPRGTYNSQRGGASAAVCTACPAGTANPHSGSDNSTACSVRPTGSNSRCDSALHTRSHLACATPFACTAHARSIELACAMAWCATAVREGNFCANPWPRNVLTVPEPWRRRFSE